MADETATNPAGAEDNAEATLPGGQEVDTSLSVDNESELDPAAEPAEEESEEIEHDGKKFTVPKALKPLLLMQADYTKKTQEVAEARRAVEAERTALHQTSQAELDAYANAMSLAGQLARYQQVDWRGWHDSDPFAASAATSEYNMLRDAHGQALARLQQLRGQRLFQQQQDTAKRMEEGRATLAQAIPEWSDTHKAALVDLATGYGFSRDELSDLEADPRVARVLHDLHKAKKASSTQQKVQNIAAAQQAQPAAKVRATSAPPAGLDDRLGVDEWMRRRNAQTRKRA